MIFIKVDIQKIQRNNNNVRKTFKCNKIYQRQTKCGINQQGGKINCQNE